MNTKPKLKLKGSNNKSQEIRRFIEKIVINAGVGRLSQQPNFEEKALKEISRDMGIISGQKAQFSPAKKSIAGFKIRQGQIVGLKVTLRRGKMVDFFEKFIKIVLPRVRDFRGINLKSIDHAGVLNIGFNEQMVFPEINPEETNAVFSLGISIVPREMKWDTAIEEYRKLGVPLKK